MIMKKVTTVISIALLYLTASAQITVTYDDLLDVGDSVDLAAVDTVPPGFGPGSTGANQHWDFSALVMDTMYTLGFIDPAITPYGSSFPFSNIAAEGLIEGFGAEGYAYATKNTSLFQIDGIAGTFDVFEDVVVPFEPAEIMFDFPVNYLDSMVQTSLLQAKVVSPEPGIDSIWLKMTTTVETKVDAWGEVMTPVWTGQVLRINDFRTTIDTVWVKFLGLWIYLESGTEVSQTYKYMANDLGYPVLQFNTDETGTEFTMVNYLLDVDTRIYETAASDKSLVIYPVPASKTVYFSISDNEIDAEIIVYDMTGRMMDLLAFNHGSKREQLNISAYPPGLYQAVMRGETGKLSQRKFIVR